MVLYPLLLFWLFWYCIFPVFVYSLVYSTRFFCPLNDPLFFRVARMSGWYAISFWCLRIYLVFFLAHKRIFFSRRLFFLISSYLCRLVFFFSQVIYSPFSFYCFWVGFFFSFLLICNVDRWRNGREGVTIRRFSWGT